MNSIIKTKDLSLPRVGTMPDIFVPSGGHLLLLGPSGCGKTTMLHVLAGLLRPVSGDVFFKEQSYLKMTDAAIDKLRGENFGFIFQRVHLIGHLSVAQNIALSFSASGKAVDMARIEELLSVLDLSAKKNAKANNLSQGQAQRAEIARALVHRPAVIFADEPTSALDDENARRVADLLISQAKATGASLIVSTHDARIKPFFANVMEMGA